MRLYVQHLDGRLLEIEVDPTARIHDLKILLWMRTGLAPDTQRLVFAGRQLEETRTVSDYNIQVDSKLFLLLRMRGD